MSAPITYPDIHFVRAATGWLELDDIAEAESELSKVSQAAQLHPEVLELRWRLKAHGLHWKACLEIAETTVQVAPEDVSGWIHRSFALHELKRTREALEKILPAVELFPGNWTVSYNIACYHCQLNELSAAREWLAKSFACRDLEEARSGALEDPDLQSLWSEIPSITPIHSAKGKERNQ